MKTAFILFFVVLMWGLTAKAGLPPTTLSGQSQTIKPTTFTFKTPNNQSTQTSGIESLIETGNTNILSNPSFEHSTFSTSWTNSAGTFTQEASVVIDGKASAKLVLAAQTMSLTQSSTLYAAQFADGVQGLAMVRVKSDIALKVCSIQAGTVSTTNCVTTNTDSKWGLYKVPFILSATSNGISIASTGSASGTVYADEAFVGAVDLKQDINNVGPWRLYTPTYTGFGTVTDQLQWRQVGQNIEIKGKFVSGATTVTEARVSLPTGYTSAGTSVIPSIQMVGKAVRGIATTITIKQFVILAEPSVAYVTIGRDDYTSAINPLAKQNGNSITSITEEFSFFASVPVAELSGSSSVYTASCGANCVDFYSAKFSSTGVISNENVDWINGNCTNSAGSGACTLVTGLVTESNGLNCTITHDNSVDARIYSRTITTSTTQVTFATVNSAGTGTSTGGTLHCQKQGADFVATRNIVGSFNEVVTSPGISKPKVCRIMNGGASDTTSCTASPCTEYFDSCGTASACTRLSTGIYGCTWANGTWANSSYVSCSPDGGNARVVGISGTKTDANGSLVNAGVFSINSAFTSVDSYFSLRCEGKAP